MTFALSDPRIHQDVTWQDIRLAAGEGDLTPQTVLQAANTIWKRRLEVIMQAEAWRLATISARSAPYTHYAGLETHVHRAASVIASMEEVEENPWRPICDYDPSMGEVETFGCIHSPQTSFGELPAVQRSRLTEYGFASDEWGSHEPVFFRRLPDAPLPRDGR